MCLSFTCPLFIIPPLLGFSSQPPNGPSCIVPVARSPSSMVPVSHCPLPHGPLSDCPLPHGNGGDGGGAGGRKLSPRKMAVARCTANKLMSVAQLRLANLIFNRHSGYSPVDRESDRKTLQRSDGHWFDSGRLNIFCVALAHSETLCFAIAIVSTVAAFRHVMDTLGIEPKASRIPSGCDTIKQCAHCSE